MRDETKLDEIESKNPLEVRLEVPPLRIKLLYEDYFRDYEDYIVATSIFAALFFGALINYLDLYRKVIFILLIVSGILTFFFALRALQKRKKMLRAPRKFIKCFPEL